jgi:hypothetical protein
MRDEADLRAALRTLERHAPDPDATLAAVRSAGAAPASRRWHRRVAAPVAARRWAPVAAPLAAAAAVIAVVTGLALIGNMTGPRHGGTAASASLVKVPTSPWRPGDFALRALTFGTLRGGYVRSTFCVWLAGPGGREAVIWPAGYRARIHPLELVDAAGTVVARDGDRISVAGGQTPGGYLPGPPWSACMLGQKSAFMVMSGVTVARRP